MSTSGSVTMLGADSDCNTRQRWIPVFSFVSGSVIDGCNNQIALKSLSSLSEDGSSVVLSGSLLWPVFVLQKF